MNTVNLLTGIADELGAADSIAGLLPYVTPSADTHVRLGILGQPNAGKTSVINALTGLRLPASPIPAPDNFRLVPQQGAAAPQLPLRGDVNVDSQWMLDLNVEIIEEHTELLESATPLEVGRIASGFDACIFVISALSPLSRSELFMIENLAAAEVPVLLLVGRSDQLTPADRASSGSYIAETIAAFPSVAVCAPEGGLLQPGSVADIRQAAAALIARTDVAEVRSTYSDFFLGAALAELYEQCAARIAAVDQRRVEIENKATDRRFALDTRVTEWIELETELRRRMLDVTDILRTTLEERRQANLRRFYRDIDCFQGDLKLFWDVDFPYRFEETSKMDSDAAAAVVNRVFADVIAWLQGELTRRFHVKMGVIAGIESSSGGCEFSRPGDVKVADTSKMKIFTRLGTTAAVVGGSALLVTAGVGGAVIGISMLSSLGAELFMGKRSKEDKEKIKQALPAIVDRARYETVAIFSAKVSELTDTLAGNLAELRAEWLDNQNRIIDHEREIALFNAGKEKWEGVMQRIDQLSAIVLQ